jgi:hypothetical protein
MTTRLWGLRCHRNLFGDGPHKALQFPGNGYNHLVGVFASGQQASKAFAQPHLHLPTDVLDRLRKRFQPELQSECAAALREADANTQAETCKQCL